MNNLKKIGISALAGSLAAFSANAVEMSVAGSAKVTYISNDPTEVVGNPYGMNTSLAFTGSGEVNGYATTLVVVNNDANTGLSSAALSVDLGDMGTVHFDQGVGKAGLSTIDDVMPTAYEESWDGIDAAATTSKNGLVGMGNSGVWGYVNSYEGTKLSASYGNGSNSVQTDDAVSGTGHGSSWDFALTNATLYEGVDLGVGYGKISNDNGDALLGSSDDDQHMTAYVKYSMGPVTVGYQQTDRQDNTQGGIDERAESMGIAINLMEGLSASYNDREIEFENPSAANVTEDATGIALAYTMGSAAIKLQHNEVDNNDGGTTSDENTEIALSLAF
jgi:outer membrane protein OmpU